MGNEKCNQNDGLFVDGGLIDNPALVTGITTYQKQTNYDSNRIIKAVVNIHNEGTDPVDDFSQFLGYFETSFNKDVQPGGFVFRPKGWIPQPSVQIFAESLEEDALIDMLKPIEGTNVTYATFQTTTVDNPVYEVRAGQSVELLVFFLNYNITTFVFGQKTIKEATPQLANMISDITSSQDVVNVVKNFFGEVDA